MKIAAELVRVLQEWEPDTNTHSNKVIFSFAGVHVTVPVTEAQVHAIIVESQRQIHSGEATVPAPTPGPRAWRDLDGKWQDPDEGREPYDDRRASPPPVRGHRGVGKPTTLQEITATGEDDGSQGIGVSSDAPIDESAGGEGLDDALANELTTEEGDTVFGGDFADPNVPVRVAPQLFQGDDPGAAPSLDATLSPKAPAPPPTPTQQRQAAVAAHRAQDPAQQRQATKTAMRERAAQVPMRRVPKDEAGNPEPYTDKSARIVGPAGRPEVVVRQQTPNVGTGGDDDGFAQG